MGTTTLCIAVRDPVPDTREIEGGLEMAVEVILRDESFQGGEDGTIRIAGLGWTEHRGGTSVETMKPPHVSRTRISRLCEHAPSAPYASENPSFLRSAPLSRCTI